MVEPRKPRRRRDLAKGQKTHTAAKHVAQKATGALQTLIGLVLLLGTAGALIYFFFFYQAPENNSIDQNYRVLTKQMVNGSMTADAIKRGEQTKEFAEWVDPKFYIICKGDLSKAMVVFEAPESAFNGTPVGSTLTAKEVASWKVADINSPTLLEVLEGKTGLTFPVGGQ